MECERKETGRERWQGFRPERKDMVTSQGEREDRSGTERNLDFSSGLTFGLEGLFAMSIKCSPVMPGRQRENAAWTPGVRSRLGYEFGSHEHERWASAR